MSAPVSASSLPCVVFICAIAMLSYIANDLALATYSLGFWHYLLYWLAYRFGAVRLQVFKSDAILMKTASLSLCGWAYFMAGIDFASLAMVAVGFSLNVLAARALGSDRTYYGYELAAVPPRKVTHFPYSWFSHPMLFGNVVAFSGMLINHGFRAQWWPLACIHLALNLGLLIMEIGVVPQGLGTRGSRGSLSSLGFPVLCAAVGTGAGFWTALRTNALIGTTLGMCVAGYALYMYRCYSEPGPQWPLAFNRRKTR